ncbi:hypothetical protein ACNO5E_14180 [Vibrio parahaemolyticus]|uniref:hypothetical protein n=1 Tax=Vibrio parahaemolyticus TaxID=670 RepID=UPI000812D6B4|nr:hypothetical protein [Vibrio parahaemolyticus]
MSTSFNNNTINFNGISFNFRGHTYLLIDDKSLTIGTDDSSFFAPLEQLKMTKNELVIKFESMGFNQEETDKYGMVELVRNQQKEI